MHAFFTLNVLWGNAWPPRSPTALNTYLRGYMMFSRQQLYGFISARTIPVTALADFRETLVGILMLYAASWAHETMQLSIIHCLYYFHVDFVCAFGNTLERTHSQSQCWPWKGQVLPAPCSWIGQQENRKCDVHPLDALAGCTGSRLSRDMQRTGRELLLDVRLCRARNFAQAFYGVSPTQISLRIYTLIIV